jgi:cytochrome c
MKTSLKLAALVLPLFVLSVIFPFQQTVAQQVSPSPTPTYDPFAEPPLPENPTEYELGRNLYWHWCMTCHGDKGQGLTDEFRGIWVEDHQDCWGRGCHAGHPGDMGFPIPTVVPALVNDAHLASFTSVQELSDFLKATHPPQSPGILKDEEYHDIALFVFAMNERSLIDFIATETPVPTSTVTPIPSQEAAPDSIPLYIIVILGFLVAGVFLVIRKTNSQNKQDSHV